MADCSPLHRDECARPGDVFMSADLLNHNVSGTYVSTVSETQGPGAAGGIRVMLQGVVAWGRELLMIGFVFAGIVCLGSGMTQSTDSESPVAASSTSESGVIRLFPMESENAVWIVRAHGPIRLVAISSGEVLRSFDISSRCYPTFTASADGETYLSVSELGNNSVLYRSIGEANALNLRETFGSQWPADFSFAPDNEKLLITMSSGEVIERSLDDISCPQGGNLSESALLAKYSPDGSRIVIAGTDGSLRILDAKTKACLRHEICVTDRAISLAWSQRNTVAAGYLNGTVVCLSEDASQLPVKEKIAQDQICSLAFSPDGSVIAAGGFDKNCQLLNADTLAQIRVLKGHTGAVRQVCFVNNGERLLTGGLDGSIKVWGASGSTPIYELN